MHGEGEIDYGNMSERLGDKSYKGQFHLNSREGKGILTKTNGIVYKGDFKNNQPNGFQNIQFANGDQYEGEVIRGVMTGVGFL